jgi:hypothetical protein
VETLLWKRTKGADQLAELIDILSLDDGIRRPVVRLLGELEAESDARERGDYPISYSMMPTMSLPLAGVMQCGNEDDSW